MVKKLRAVLIIGICFIVGLILLTLSYEVQEGLQRLAFQVWGFLMIAIGFLIIVLIATHVIDKKIK